MDLSFHSNCMAVTFLDEGDMMTVPVHILICDDHIAVHESISAYLQAEGMSFASVFHGEDVLRRLENEHFDLLILDVMLPGLFGTDICRSIRQQSEIPIIMLSARSEESDRILGLELGADDYITKPFSPREVVTRIKTILKRTHGHTQTTPPEKEIRIGNMIIDRHAFEVRIHGQKPDFTPREIELLILFASNRDCLLSREQILNKLWGYDYAGDIRAVDHLIKRMRKKFPEQSPGFEIKTVYGMGYRLESIL